MDLIADLKVSDKTVESDVTVHYDDALGSGSVECRRILGPGVPDSDWGPDLSPHPSASPINCRSVARGNGTRAAGLPHSASGRVVSSLVHHRHGLFERSDLQHQVPIEVLPAHADALTKRAESRQPGFEAVLTSLESDKLEQAGSVALHFVLCLLLGIREHKRDARKRSPLRVADRS